MKQDTISVAEVKEALDSLAWSNNFLEGLGSASSPEDLRLAPKVRVANQELKEALSDCIRAGGIR